MRVVNWNAPFVVTGRLLPPLSRSVTVSPAPMPESFPPIV